MNLKIIFIILALFSAIFFVYVYPFIYDKNITDFQISPRFVNTTNIFYGNASAPISIITYSGFTCSACKKYYNEIFLQIEKEYINKNKVKYYHKTFLSKADLKNNNTEFKLSNALFCVKQRNPAKYWEFYKLLFSKNVAEIESQDCGFDNEIDERIFFGINEQPTIIVGINGRQNTLIYGLPTWHKLNKTIRQKEIFLGVNK